MHSAGFDALLKEEAGGEAARAAKRRGRTERAQVCATALTRAACIDSWTQTCARACTPTDRCPPKNPCAHSRTRVHTHRQFTHTPSTQSTNTQHTRDDDTHAHTYACNLTHDDIKLDSARYSLSSSEGSWVALEQGKEVVERQILPNTKVVFAKFSPAARGGRLVQAAGRHGEMIPSAGPWF